MSRAPRSHRRHIVGLVLVLVATAGLAGLASAQLPTRATMPEPIVLVVRAENDTLVRPTTGVVVGRSRAGDGLVVVPADFVASDAALFVLDGGTDLQRDGLPARVARESEEEGLAVLAVPGLSRPVARVTFNPPPTEHELRLAAWPPAEMMATGAPPFWIPVNVSGKATGADQTLLPGESVPNLTGPLLDLCGQWAGLVIASGEPGIDAAQPPRVVLNDELLRIAEVMELDLRLESCMQVAPVGGVAAPVAPAPSDGAARADRRGLGEVRRMLDEANLGMGALVFLLSALLSGLLFWYLIKRRAEAQRRQKIRRTLQTETMTFSPTGMPSRPSRPTQEPTTFNPGTRPPGSTGWLRIEGSHADGRPLRAITALGDGKFQAVIGRAGVELAADGPGISRRHAVIVSEGGRFTLSDLGSRNGTFVNGVRCQQDEIFYVKEGDKILLGAAEVTLRLSAGKGSGK